METTRVATLVLVVQNYPKIVFEGDSIGLALGCRLMFRSQRNGSWEEWNLFCKSMAPSRLDVHMSRLIEVNAS